MIFGEGVTAFPIRPVLRCPGFKAETLLMAFDLDGVAVSSGSACSSGKVGRSHVLDAMGVAPELAAGAIRVSLGWNTTARRLRALRAAWQPACVAGSKPGAAA